MRALRLIYDTYGQSTLLRAVIATSLTVDLVAYLVIEMSSPLITEEKAAKGTLGVEWVGNFELLKRIPLNYTDVVTITKWLSKETGLKVVHVDHEGPIIDGYFAVATESEHFTSFDPW